jgi:hypothetical protein
LEVTERRGKEGERREKRERERREREEGEGVERSEERGEKYRVETIVAHDEVFVFRVFIEVLPG